MKLRGLAVAVVVALAPAAAAEPCNPERLDSGLPIQVPQGPAGFGTLPGACAATRVGLVGAGSALVASEDFYGYLWGSARLSARYALPGGAWFSLETPSLDYWFSANATVEADTVALGPGAFGYHVPLPAVAGVQLSPYVQVLLPTDTVYHRARRYGLSHGVSALYPITPSLELVGGLTFPLLMVHNSGSLYSTQSSQAAVDVSYRLFSFLSLAAGLGVRVRSGKVPGFEALDPRLALRFEPYRKSYVHLALATPVLGDDRTDLTAALLAGWHFEPASAH